jgi:hypothetical protein
MSESEVRDASGRFVKGHPGGPGRPRNPFSAAIMDYDVIAMQAAERVIAVIVEQALKGDLKAAELVLRRVWPVRRNRPIAVNTPEDIDAPYLIAQHARLAVAMMDGDFTAQDAQAAARVLKLLQEQMKAAEGLTLSPDGEKG